MLSGRCLDFSVGEGAFVIGLNQISSFFSSSILIGRTLVYHSRFSF